jgi:hypothetical protein
MYPRRHPGRSHLASWLVKAEKPTKKTLQLVLNHGGQVLAGHPKKLPPSLSRIREALRKLLTPEFFEEKRDGQG